MPPLHQAILNTVIYFDLFDYPLTAVEVWRFLYAPGLDKKTFEEVFFELETMIKENKLETKKGFYFLSGRGVILDIRAERYALSFPKYRKARRFSKILSFVPGVRMIALCNTLAWRHARASSDIDFFIVAASGRLWSVRFFSVLLAAIFGVRPSKNKEAIDALCLSFFASEDALDLKRLMIVDDIYFPYWVISIVPLFASEGIVEKFKKANAWIYALLPNTFFYSPSRSPARINIFSVMIPDFAERFFKKIQSWMFPVDISQKAAFGKSEVVISDVYLKFHTNDKRASIRDEWQKKIALRQMI